MPPTYAITRPAVWRGGLILASPHSGRTYPEAFVRRSGLHLAQLRSSEDVLVDRLAAPAAAAAGAVMLRALIGRAMVDLNRARTELDPQVVTGAPPPPPDSRALAGLGVIPRVVARGRLIRAAPMAMDEAQALLDSGWQPYHDALQALMDEAMERFGRAVLIDLHSMPREALRHLSPRPHVVLGDRFGQSAGGWLREALRAALEAEGLQVRLNAPFAGAYIAACYGNPGAGRHVIQLEVDRSLYADEARLVAHRGFAPLAGQLARAIAALNPGEDALAAE